MPKALLILFGGRSMPNMLTIIHEKPDVVAVIVSKDQASKLPQFQRAIDALFVKDVQNKPELRTDHVVDAYKVGEIHAQCLRAVEDNPHYKWIFNITAATKIMSIGAYEAVKELRAQGKSISCWYLDTSHSKVVYLFGEERDSTLFDITVSKYAAVYNCRVENGILEDQRQYCQEHWIPFTQFLVKHLHYIDLLKRILKKINPAPSHPKKGAGNRRYTIKPETDEVYMLLEEAYRANLLEYLDRSDDAITIKLSYTQYNFLNGPWLEAYVWNVANQLGIFSDCQWNQKLLDDKETDDNKNRNELDVTMIYRAQLLVVECKTTEEDSFDTDFIYKLDSVTGPLGGYFVSKMFVTSQPLPDGKDANKLREFDRFKDKAEDRGIMIVTREQLGDIKTELEKLAKRVRI